MSVFDRQSSNREKISMTRLGNDGAIFQECTEDDMVIRACREFVGPATELVCKNHAGSFLVFPACMVLSGANGSSVAHDAE
jgi:hypothetical protein